MGVDLLKNMYEEDKGESKWLGRFQSRVIQDIMRQDEEIRDLLGVAVCVQERDLESVMKVFLPINEARFEPLDYKMLMDWAKLGRDLNGERNKKKTIYLECDSMTAYGRMQRRAREGEKGMSFEDFRRVNEEMGALKEEAEFVLDTTELNEKDIFEFVRRIIIQA